MQGQVLDHGWQEASGVARGGVAFFNRLTDAGMRIALFYSRTYARTLRSGLTLTLDNKTPNPIRKAFQKLEFLIDQHCNKAKLAA